MESWGPAAARFEATTLTAGRCIPDDSPAPGPLIISRSRLDAARARLATRSLPRFLCLSISVWTGRETRSWISSRTTPHLSHPNSDSGRHWINRFVSGNRYRVQIGHLSRLFGLQHRAALRSNIPRSANPNNRIRTGLTIGGPALHSSLLAWLPGLGKLNRVEVSKLVGVGRSTTTAANSTLIPTARKRRA